MLRTNLASRPFYNDRAVRVAIVAAVVLLAGLSAFNVLEVLSLNDRNRQVDARVQSAEALTAKYRAQARAITDATNVEEMESLQNAAREANRLIEQRVFSWTDLFNRFEATLPPDVRITSVEPQIDREGRLLVSASVVSKRVEDLNEFLDQLEATAGFRDVISRQDAATEEGNLRSVVQGYYDPAIPPAAAPASDTAREADNASPSAPVPPPAPEGATR